MIVIGVFFAIAIGLFAAAFFSKRRFGLLGLALAAGATLSTMWQQDAGYVVATLGVIDDPTIASAVSLSAVVLLPAILLLFHGHKYKSLVGRVIGALLFTVLALAFLVEPIGFALPLTGFAATVYQTIDANKELIISIGLVIAVVDLFFTKPAPRHDGEKHKSH
jgi:hypothetical protein